ncbi:MAG: hypothetical protein H6739_21270 [Alphaproteobacteria bacterium]|nr:hypothetical protein [Alphaproteobacteria bacterium]
MLPKLTPHLPTLTLLALLAGPGAALVLPQDAIAQQAVFAGAGLIEILPAGPAVADGATAVTMHALLLNPDGSAMTGVRPKLAAKEGTADGWTELGGGLYQFTYKPPRRDSAGTTSISIKGKTPSKEALETEVTVALLAPMPTGMTIASNPAQLVLGQDKSVSLNFTLSGGAGQPQAGAKLKVLASSGTIENLTHLGNGEFTARYVAPAVNYPHIAIITVVDERSPSTLYGAHAIHLVGKTDFPVSSAPGATVIVRINDRDFGPYTTDAGGGARVPLMVPPGVQSATLVSVVNGNKTEEPLDLKLPATRRISFFPTNTAIPGDPSVSVPVRVAVTTPQGQPDPGAKVRLTASGGTISEATHEGNGVYKAMFTPPRMIDGGNVTLQVAIEGEPGVQSTSMMVSVAPTTAGTVTQTPEPATLPSGSTGFKVYNKVTSLDGTGLGGRAIVFNASGARPQGETRDLRSGDYETTFSTTSDQGVQVTATVPGAVSGNPLRHVVLLPTQERVANDGTTTTQISVFTVDEFGYAVPDVPVTLKLVTGDGQLAKQLVTNAQGLGGTFYTSGRQAGLVRIQATAGDVVGATALLQLPAGAAGVDLPVSGSEAVRAMISGFERRTPTAILPREGAQSIAATMGPIDPSGQAGALTAFTVTAQPSQIAPGGSVTIRIQAQDAEGRGVAGHGVKVLATGGTATPARDLGGGAYESTLSVPQGATGEAMVVITSADGAITRALPVTVNAPTWGSTAEPVATTTTTPTEPVATTTPSTVAPTTTTTIEKPPREPREPGDYPFMRFRVGGLYGLYSYTQTSEASNSPLWQDPVNVSAGMGGFDVDVVAFLPMFEYVGAEAKVRTGFYSIVWPGTGDFEIPDAVPNIAVSAIGRFPIDLGSARIAPGVKVGALYGDFITYQLDDTNNELIWEAIGLPGLGVGVDVGLEVGERFHAHADYVQGLRGISPFSYNAGLDLGFTVVGPLYLGAGMDWTARTTTVVAGAAAAPIGTLKDNQVVFMAGPGLEF